MSRRAKGYVALVSIIGVINVYFCCRNSLQIWQQEGLADGIWVFISMLALCTLCRSFPIYMRTDQAIDVSVISIVAICLFRGPGIAVAMYFLSSFLSFDRTRGEGRCITLYNTPIYKTLFNLGNVALSILLPATLCNLLGIRPGELDFPFVLVPTLIYSIGSFVINALLMFGLFHLTGPINVRDAFAKTMGLMPSVMAAMPISLLIALLYQMPSGEWLVLVMLLPMLLARYAWKLYLDSKTQQVRLVHALVSTMEAKDAYTQGHSMRVEGYAVRIARAMHFREAQVQRISEGALLHDLGKIGVDDTILRKPGPLTQEERNLMERHPEIGVMIVSDLQLSPEVVEMIHDHHRRYDGGGYPAREDKARPGMYALILGVADAYDAMTSDRPYRKGMKPQRALAILKEEAGRQFDPEVVEIFTRIMEADA